jgi:hypothetical protein
MTVETLLKEVFSISSSKPAIGFWPVDQEYETLPWLRLWGRRSMAMANASLYYRSAPETGLYPV